MVDRAHSHNHFSNETRMSLAQFKTGIRGSYEADAEGKLMHPMAQPLTDQQAIDTVIAYIQSLDQ